MTKWSGTSSLASITSLILAGYHRVLNGLGVAEPSTNPPSLECNDDARANGPAAEHVHLEHSKVEDAARRERREHEADRVQVTQQLEQSRARVQHRHLSGVLDDHEPSLVDRPARETPRMTSPGPFVKTRAARHAMTTTTSNDVIALRAQASAAQRSEESRLSG
jgi:hypothetical protein